MAHSPSEQDQCVVETLEELSSGLGSAPSGDAAANGDDAPGRRTLDHLILHHPSSARGAAMRARRTKLEAALAALDRLIQTDGTVQPLPADGEVEGVVQKLQLVQKECSGILRSEDDEGDERTTTSTDGRHAYRSLVVFQTTTSIYTLMSLLGAVGLPSASASVSASESDGGGNGNFNEVSEPTEREERVLRQVCRTLTVLLSPPTGALIRAIQSDNNAIAVDDANGSGEGGADADASSEADQAIAAALSPPAQLLKLIKSTTSDIRDSFVAFERLVGLIGRYTALVATANGNDEGAWGVLTDLARLAAAACGGCERNKVAFVRAGKQKKEQNAAGGGGSGGNGRDGSGGIAAVVAVLTMLTQQSEGTNGEAKVVVQPAMAAYCKFLAVLCRFDDFRSPSATSNGGGGGGALPTPDMTVSSAHDHVLEFHRQRIVPILHEVTSLALKENECGDGGQDGNGGVGRDTDLASAALAATRTLAVNDEIVQALVAVGVLRSARLALAAGVADADGGNSTEDKTKAKQRRALTSASLGLIRNLCGNDEIKTNLCLGTADGNVETSTVLPSIIQAMRFYRTDAAVQEHGCATLAAMALRKPANAQLSRRVGRWRY